MAPNHAIATRYGEQAQIETFFMSNICPQRPDPNRKVWKHLEATEADDYGNRFEEVWVIDGPIFPDGPSEKLPTGVITVGQAGPALVLLAGDVRLGRFPLGVERVEVLLQALIGGLAGVDGAAAE